MSRPPRRAAGLLAGLPVLAAALASWACAGGGGEPPRAVQILRLHDLLPAAGEPTGAELAGVWVPVLDAGASLEVPLPAEVLGRGPRPVIFEARLGIAPEVRRPGVEARFQLWVDDAGGRRLALDRRVSAAEEEPEAWEPVAVPLTLGDGARLVLEAEARAGGTALPASAALWGNPRLVTGPAPGLNLVVVGIDTLRADVLGSYGDPGGLTPSLDAFAARSVRFADLAAPAPWTLPSFATLLTGLQPQTHGAGKRLEDGAKGALPPAAVTLAEVLAGAGFDTAGIYNNVYLSPAYGLQQGFDEHIAFHHSRRAGELVDRALGWLDGHGGRRFFLFLQVLDPHTPYTPPKPFCWQQIDALPEAERRHGCRLTRRAGGEDVPPDRRPWAAALYRAEVAYTDTQMGRLLAGLEDRGLMEKTVVLVVSDHGEELWEHQEQERARGYEPVADHGHSLYGELVRVPGLLWVPGGSPAVVEEPAELADFAPTLLTLLGVEPPLHPGRDLLSGSAAGASGEGSPWVGGFLLYGPERAAVRRGPWKLIVPVGGEGGSELYDLEGDPGEHLDLSAERPELAAELRGVLQRALAERRQLGHRLGLESSRPAQLDPERQESLRALGYVD